MSIIAPVIRHMMALKMPVEDIVAVVSEMEAKIVASSRAGPRLKRVAPIRAEPSDMFRNSDFPPSAFENWYRLYPHKVGRAAAEKAFEKVGREHLATYKELCDGVARYIKAKPKDRDWCHPSTWLNQARWADVPAPPQPQLQSVMGL